MRSVLWVIGSSVSTGHIIHIVNVSKVVAELSSHRLPLGITKEPGREDDQDTVEN